MPITFVRFWRLRLKTYTFKIVMNRRPTEAELDRLHEAGCDDAILGIERGLPTATFDRDHETLADAIASAVRALESASLIPLRVIDEDVLTLADIADRIGQSRESVRRYATGDRGSGGFPPPINPGREGTVFYRWSEVVPWLRETSRWRSRTRIPLWQWRILCFRRGASAIGYHTGRP